VKHAHIRVVKLRWVHGKVSTPKSFEIRPEKATIFKRRLEIK
jgi:hypothetical protein